MKVKTLEDLKKYVDDAYKNSNFFDSEYFIEELKKSYSEKEIISFLKKEIKSRKNNEKQLEKEINVLKERYKPTNYYLFEEALHWVTHKYQRGDVVLFESYGKIKIGIIRSKTSKGYKIFHGRKLGVLYTVPCNKVFCHVSNTKKVKEIIKGDD